MRIYLINAENGDSTPCTANEAVFPPLGVISLGTVLSGKYDVNVFDGQVTPHTEIVNRIYADMPDVVGVSVLGPSYGPALEYAKAAKESGSYVIFGNDHAAFHAEKILRRRKYINAVCTADMGEFAMPHIIDFFAGSIDAGSVPDFVYRKPNGDIARNRKTVAAGKDALDKIPIPNRKDFLAGRKYLDNYKAKYGDDATGVTTINRARGCSRFLDRCGFCGISDLTMRTSSPEMFWKDVLAGMKDVDANVFYEACDSFSSQRKWLKNLAARKPSEAENARFFAYTQAREVVEHPEIVKYYKAIGVFVANMGLESGDDTMLKRLKGPRDSVETNRKAVAMLRESGILANASFVIGGPGETNVSLANTVDFARWLIDERAVVSVELTPVYPGTNSRYGSYLVNKDLRRRAAERLGFRIKHENMLDAMKAGIEESDNPDSAEMTRLFNRCFSEVPLPRLREAMEDVRDYAKRAGVIFGSAISE